MDDYLDDDYDNDPIPMPVNPPQALGKQTMPGSYGAGTGRTGSGSAGVAGGGPGGGGTIR